MVVSNSLNISFFFLLLIHSTSPLYFNLSSIRPGDTNHSINVTGAAYITEEGIQVTPTNVTLGGTIGRATYIQQLHLWDKASGALTDFTTHFSFVIDSSGNPNYADGLAFFLAPVGSSIPANAAGSGLGLVGGNTISNFPENQFFAVEFDTYSNGWDPNFTHVGININSMKSVSTAIWLNNITQGQENDAWISYNSSSKTLEIFFTGFSIIGSQKDRLYYVLNLMDYLPEWVTFGFSAATGDYFEINNVKKWEFNSSLQFDAYESNPSLSPNLDSSVAATRVKKHKIGLVLVLGVSLSVLIGGLGLVGYCLLKKRKTEEEEEHVFESSMEDRFEKGSGPKKFSYGALVCATKNFAEQEKLGEGGFGGVYRGFLRELNSYVAIKRISRGSKQGIREYESEVTIISRLRHRNLVQLKGWCHEKKELLLVYEFMANGSLDSHLFKKIVLSWNLRYNIAKGLASALLYLHEGWEECVIHRDIKPSNIMLDSNFNAKLGDFGLARLVDHEKGSETTVLAGTLGYMDPECVITGKASKESDVYSFGVVCLEIACGRKPSSFSVQESQMTIVEWVWDLYESGKILEAADQKLCVDFDKQEMERLLVVGLWCTHPDYHLRSSIRQATLVLNCETPLPILPSTMPHVPRSFGPPANMPISWLSSSGGTTISQIS
ncbi:unnamed protein product [Ilex paraguariensis]|uniref:Protein kinase domain-containing protein n=1 Tax=Ilex paraguariensis TaxID=185542 RepID=A0ABC8T1S2_9AQUA